MVWMFQDSQTVEYVREDRPASIDATEAVARRPSIPHQIATAVSRVEPDVQWQPGHDRIACVVVEMRCGYNYGRRPGHSSQRSASAGPLDAPLPVTDPSRASSDLSRPGLRLAYAPAAVLASTRGRLLSLQAQLPRTILVKR